MQRYIVHRLLQGLLAVFFVGTLVFVLSRLTGNPLDLMLPVDAPADLRDQMAKNLGLDRSLPVQYAHFVKDIIRGDFGTSIRYGVPTLELFFDRFSNSVLLILLSFPLAFLAGIPLGVVAAVRRGGVIDTICGVLGVIGMAAPHFWLGIVLVFIFSAILGILPAARMGGPSHYVLPVFTLSLMLTAGLMRLIRSSLLENLDSEYAKLARIKGVSEWAVVVRHCLRNSLVTAVTFAGTYFAILIAGTITVEVVFAWPGSGRLLYEGIMMRDYPLVQTVIILKAVMILAVNLLIDVLYAYLDPRIRY